MKRLHLLILLILTLAFVGQAPLARAETPAVVSTKASAVVKNFHDQLISVMKQGDQIGYAGRYKKLSPVLRTTFDLPLMTRLSVGSIWNSATPEQQKALVSAFSDFSVATYANRFADYDGEQFSITGEKQTQGGVIVETSLKPKDSEAIALNYLMHADDKGVWRIVDVFLNGTISELATRRAEFSSIVTREGIAALVNSLDEKSKLLGPI